MNTLRRGFCAAACTIVLASFACAGNLRFVSSSSFNISTLNLTSIGDLAFDRAAIKLWVCDGTTGATAFQLNPTTGALISQVNASVVPGLDGGPDALAVLVAPNDVCVFSSLGESEAGRVSQAGALVADYGGAQGATGAEFDTSGHLLVVSGTVAGGGSTLLNLNASTGAIVGSQVIQTTSRMVDLAQDPHTGLYFGLTEDTNQLVQFSTVDGSLLSATDMTPFLLQTNTIHGGIAFDANGGRLFVATGTGTAADSIVVLTRKFSTISCDGNSGPTACPCGNQGLPAHGCDNSLGNGGVFLDTNGRPSIASDTMELLATGMPAGATGLFFQGTQAIGPPQHFGDGLRCVGGTIIRLATKTSPGGSLQYPAAGEASIHARGLVTSAGDRFYQLWYRNSATFCTSATFNLSNALEVHWAQ
jgi:hypothetical protein